MAAMTAARGDVLRRDQLDVLLLALEIRARCMAATSGIAASAR